MVHGHLSSRYPSASSGRCPGQHERQHHSAAAFCPSIKKRISEDVCNLCLQRCVICRYERIMLRKEFLEVHSPLIGSSLTQGAEGGVISRQQLISRSCRRTCSIYKVHYRR